MRALIRAFDNVAVRLAPASSQGQPKLLILALHSVLADRRQLDSATMLPQQRLTLAELRQALDAFQTLGYRFVSPAEVDAGLPDSGRHCLLTFDDGYRNNLDVLPLLRDRGVPALFFVVPRAIKEGRSFWWDAVYRKARRSGRAEREIAGFMAAVKRLPPSRIEEALRHAGLRDADYLPVGDLDRPLNRAELMALAATPGMTVGNHTWNHEILTHCRFADGVESLRQAQEYLRGIGGNVIDWVAYPNGDWNNDVLRMAQAAGLRGGVTLDAQANPIPLAVAPEARLRLGRFLLWGGEDMARQCARMNLAHSLERSAARVWSRVRRRPAPRASAVSPATPGALQAGWLSPRTYFVYVDAAKQSGQRRATELIIAGLTWQGHEIVRFGTRAMNRELGGLPEVLNLGWNLLGLWHHAFGMLRGKSGVMHINLGQSEAALFRDGTFVLLRALTPGRWPVIISLHGSWFMTWPRHSHKARWLGWLARRAFRTTVLGPDQRDKLAEFGVPREKIEIVDNTCEIQPAASAEISAKHAAGQFVSVLFLGLLVDTKGYPEFLEALLLYSRIRQGPRLNVTLCGDTATAAHSALFSSATDATRFIDEKLDEVRSLGWIDIRWIKGAEGEAKAALFRSTAIFVLPTKLDAQPLVLLEAMASGCAILTSNVGQIAQSVGPDAAMVMEEVSPETIASGLARLAADPGRRLAMGQAGQKQFATRFTREIHDAKWSSLVDQAFVSAAFESAPKASRIWFAFADPKGFSGQKAATLLVIDGMSTRGAECRRLPQPVRDRNSGRSPWEFIRYTAMLLLAWARCHVLLFQRGGWLHVSIGQTRFAFLRDSVPLILGRIGLGRRRVVITLNGSLFMQWDPESLNAKLFGALLRQAGTVTVLGRRQRTQLIAFGVPARSLYIVPNSCDLSPLSDDEMARKLADDHNRPIRLLHLSSLIASKGYPEYLQSLELLAQSTGRDIEAVLCGRLVESEFGGRFSTTKEAEDWIAERLASINTSTHVRVRWVRGAAGAAKIELYRAADIFVMPTHYPVEAQPLVLLEAMAMGCAIITTSVGEIGTILDTHSAVLLSRTRPETVGAAIAHLVEDHEERRQLAMEARARFAEEFQLSRHLDLWETIFSDNRMGQ